MVMFFAGGIVGSGVAALVFARYGWTGVSAVGAAFGLAAFGLAQWWDRPAAGA